MTDWEKYHWNTLVDRCEAWKTLAQALGLRLYHVQIGKPSEPALLKLIRELRERLGAEDAASD